MDTDRPIKWIIQAATRITSLYSFVSVISGSLLGIVISRVRYLKPFIIWGACCWITAMGMLIHFRGGEESRDGIIGSLCFLGFAASFFTYSTQASIQSCTDHEHMGIVTSLYLSSYQIGSALGGCISGAIWTQTLFNNISKELAKVGMTDPTVVNQAYGSPFEFILTYTWGTLERDAIVIAYKHVQRLLLITGVCLCVPLLFLTFFLRNYKLISAQNRFDTEIQNDEKIKRELEEEEQKKIAVEKSGIVAKLRGLI